MGYLSVGKRGELYLSDDRLIGPYFAWGMDCNHFQDYSPEMETMMRGAEDMLRAQPVRHYRDLDYVRTSVEHMGNALVNYLALTGELKW